jgi:transcriptional regulator with XRE-family HTH domain
MNDLNQSPFRPLGRKLKNLRVQAKESLAETSGAVEIDVRELASFELGRARPSQDVLLLLISHFGTKDDEAVKLWEMAGYGVEKVAISLIDSSSQSAPSTPDNRILFTDIVDVMVNNYGVVMNFMQSGPGNSTSSVARVGMSREHAKSILKILETTLSQTERRQSGKITSPKDNQKSKTDI